MVDLHMHSTYSDGTDDIEALINNVEEANLNCFALTDHDTAEGCRMILSNEKIKTKLKEKTIDFIVGSEWTCIYGNQKMHILANRYLIFYFLHLFLHFLRNKHFLCTLI